MDIRRAYSMFLDVKRSSDYLKDHQSQYLFSEESHNPNKMEAEWVYQHIYSYFIIIIMWLVVFPMIFRFPREVPVSLHLLTSKIEGIQIRNPLCYNWTYPLKLSKFHQYYSTYFFRLEHPCLSSTLLLLPSTPPSS